MVKVQEVRSRSGEVAEAEISIEPKAYQESNLKAQPSCSGPRSIVATGHRSSRLEEEASTKMSSRHRPRRVGEQRAIWGTGSE